ncbi:hypothetical protein EXU57_13815 [Segetibacter sp. 3557_3]|uniref:YhdP family protein n=1 Tax=Segetibacter sp. 3557_3 TaxID=2547429 RepID=UPI001058ECDE|nr:AsmA-like C-terminal region-containing protein [Segetibacter sp. 3557_3]TDH25178.1 hypothetical protein EXU57_13815 [Segetibacter sp. 3557_3]
MNKYLKNTLKGFGFLVGFLLVLYIIVYVYVTTNKKSIVSQITTEIGKRIEGDVSIRDVDLSFFTSFPSVSVVLRDISVKDTLFQQHQHTFFQAAQVFVRVGFWKLIKKESALTGIQIRKGSLYLFTDSTGYSNSYLLKQKAQAKKPASVSQNSELRDVSLNDFVVTIDDLEKQKLIDFTVQSLKADIKDEGSVLSMDVNNNIFVRSLAFYLPRGSFIKEKSFEGNYALRYNKDLKQLQFDSIDVRIAKHPFNLTGRFDLSPIEGRKPEMLLRVHTRDIGYNFARTLVTQKISKALSIVEASNKLSVSVSVQGPLKGEPLIHASWLTKNNDIKSPLIEFNDCSFAGSYTNEVVAGLPRKDPNSRIEIRKFTGKWQGLPITSENILINDLYKPLLTCDLKSKFPLTTLNGLLNSASITLNSGQAEADLKYKGPLQRNTTNNSFVNGVINIRNGLINYNPRGIPLQNVNGKIVFRNSDVFVQNLQCEVLNNSIIMEGTARNVLTLVNTQVNKVVLDWSVYSPSLNLAAFTSLLKKRQNVVAKKGIGNQIESAARKLDEVLEKGSIDVSLRADKLIYKKFQATNVTGLINMLQDSWILQKISLNHAGGQMEITGSLKDKNVNYHDAKARISLTNMDVSRVFGAFDNFGQDGITSESLRGQLTSEVNLYVGLDDNGNVYPSTIDGLVVFSLKNGALLNYEPVKKLQNFLFKNRDFDNIQFAELKDTLEIKNQEVKIKRMEIQSSVLSMFVEGVYSMKKTTDLSIQIPLSNLKKRDKDYTPENVGTDKKGGTSVYIRGTPGPDGNIKFRYDLFKKFRDNED